MLTGGEKQHGHGLEEFLTMGPAALAISVFIDKEGFIHSKDRPSQAFDSYDHYNREVEFFPLHLDYGHQRHSINMDGTISLDCDPTFVLGTDDDQKRVRWIKRGSRHQFIFDQANDYMTKMLQANK